MFGEGEEKQVKVSSRERGGGSYALFRGQGRDLGRAGGSGNQRKEAGAGTGLWWPQENVIDAARGGGGGGGGEGGPGRAERTREGVVSPAKEKGRYEGKDTEKCGLRGREAEDLRC